MNSIARTAESVAEQYDYIGKMDFIKTVKEIEGSLGKNGVQIILTVWRKYYEQPARKLPKFKKNSTVIGNQYYNGRILHFGRLTKKSETVRLFFRSQQFNFNILV